MKCQSCSHDISASAHVCPVCGDDTSASRSALTDRKMLIIFASTGMSVVALLLLHALL